MQDIYLYYFKMKKSDDVLLSGIWKTKKVVVSERSKQKYDYDSRRKILCIIAIKT